jgi:predicted ATPase
MPRSRSIRIVLTGGPGGGKTTAADMIAREFPDRVVALKETATILFEGGFPRNGGPAARRACQLAIYGTQCRLEEAVAAEHPDRILLCDRGTLDGCAYWPAGPEDFFATLGTTAERERARYDAVIFFESAAVAGHDVDRRNRFRIESTAEAARLDAALRSAWSQHPRFRLIPHSPSFFAKVGAAIKEFASLVKELES